MISGDKIYDEEDAGNIKMSTMGNIKKKSL
jgi:hypothetical protein